MVKKIILFSAIAAVLFVSSANAEVFPNLYFFYGEGCPHCAKEEHFLSQILEKKYPDLKINRYEVYNNKNNASLMQDIGQTLDVNVGGVPFLIIGEKYFVGYAEGVTSKEIEDQVKKCLSVKCSDVVADILNEKADEMSAINEKKENENIEQNKGKTIKIPFLGMVDIYKLSLPILAVTIGTLDGFNPCAMWVLLFLISFLLGMEDKKKMWILGIAFIATSAFVYFIFMSAWLNLILFLGFIFWVKIIIGLLALFGGGYNLKKFVFDKSNVCKVTNGENEQKIFQKLKSVISQRNFWLALSGIIILAFMVNLVELVCSAGLPIIYTQVLTMSGLAKWQYYFYILFYVFFFMLDDLLVFFAAMFTLKVTGITTKYTRWSHLIGGILMLVIGLLLIFKPQWLMFG